MFRGAEVRATGLSLRGDHGWAYRGVTLHAEPGGVTAVTGQAGTGRTSLLLTLAGRMRPTEGTLSVAGHTTPKTIRRIAALGLVDGVNDLEKALSVAEHLHERSPGLLRRGRQEARAARALELAGLDLPPDDRTLVRDLGREQRIRLGVALALLDEPGLLVADDIDVGVTADRREAIWGTLSDLAALGLTVVASCVEDAPVPSVRLPSGAAAPEAPKAPEAEAGTAGAVVPFAGQSPPEPPAGRARTAPRRDAPDGGTPDGGTPDGKAPDGRGAGAVPGGGGEDDGHAAREEHEGENR